MRKRTVLFIGIILLAGILSAWTWHNDHQPSQLVLHSSPKRMTASHTQSTFDKTRYSLTDPTSPWVIVNKQHPLHPADYAPSDLNSVGNGQEMRAEAAAAFLHMQEDAAHAGFTIIADSGYRSYSTQEKSYSSIVTAYGQTYADTVSARPGYSEHQTGWAVDIGDNQCQVDHCFGSTPAGIWVTENAHKYGFLLRYPEGLESVTGYTHEEWHFRYIGTVLSEQMWHTGIKTLEQFFSVSGGEQYAS